MTWYTLHISSADDGVRLDRLCRYLFPNSSYGDFASWQRKKKIKVNNKKIDTSYRLKENDILYLSPSLINDILDSMRSKLQMTSTEEISKSINAKNTDIITEIQSVPAHSQDAIASQLEIVFPKEKIVFSNNNVAVIAKDAGELLFGKNSITEKLKEIETGSSYFRPVPAHRLDRGTSGALLCAMSRKGAQALHRLQTTEKIHKIYLALLEAPLYQTYCTHLLYRDEVQKKTFAYKDEQSAKKHLARTSLSFLGEASLYIHSLFPIRISSIGNKELYLSCIILQGSGGKTHQIRAQCEAMQASLWGDIKYTSNRINTKNTEYENLHEFQEKNFYLHATTLLFDEFDDLGVSQSIHTRIPTRWYDLVGNASFYLFERLDVYLEKLVLEWDTKPSSDKIDINAFCSSILGGVIG